jgi:hypothetical protein
MVYYVPILIAFDYIPDYLPGKSSAKRHGSGRYHFSSSQRSGVLPHVPSASGGCAYIFQDLAMYASSEPSAIRLSNPTANSITKNDLRGCDEVVLLGVY